jgi:hypothetical protein
MSQKSKQQDDDLEGLLVGLLGIILVMVATATVYFLIARSAPRELDEPTGHGDKIMGWVWLVFGTFFFLYGAVGVIRGKIGIGWGTYSQVRTILIGAGAFVSSVSTFIGGFLLLSTAAIYFYPSLIATLHPLATLLCGFVSIILGWACGPILRAIGY